MSSPQLPARLQPARRHVVDNAMPADWQQAAGLQLYELRRLLERFGNDDGTETYCWRLGNLEDAAPELVRPLRARLVADAAEAAKACGVQGLNPRRITFVALLLHHGGRIGWQDPTDDAPALDFELTLHTEPRMFRGGALEWIDGTTVEPNAGRLVYSDPQQQYRIAPVECWSAHVLHGRWSIAGVLS